MAVMTFAAIDIGSYEVSMKIFEMSKRIGFRELNDVRYSLEIGKGVYSDGKIDSEMLNVLCEVLNDFKRLMQDFGVEEYRVCGTSAFRELVTDLSAYRNENRNIKQCRTAFPWVQINCCYRKGIQKDDPERHRDPGCGRRQPSGFPL